MSKKKQQQQQDDPDVIKMIMDINARLGRLEGEMKILLILISALIATILAINIPHF